MIEFNKEGYIESLEFQGKKFLFNGKGPKLCAKPDPDLSMSIRPVEENDCVVLQISIANRGARELHPEKISVYLGVDCYMDHFPNWHNKLFPTLMRCEETHFYGYFMSPDGQILGIASPEPFPSYRLLYNGGGHRIESAELDIMNPQTALPRCKNSARSLKPYEVIKRRLYLFPIEKLADFEIAANVYTGAFLAEAEKYTVEMGERIHIFTEKNVDVDILSPGGEHLNNGDRAREHGVYTVKCRRADKIRELCVYCRKDWPFYLKAARKQAVDIPQKATTHCESWYGLFSGYLAAKHYPHEELDGLIEEKFQEIMPLMFDMDNGLPELSPYRIQNVSSLISLLVDRYEANPVKNADSMELANKLAEYLILSQEADGGYYQQGKIHFTCVIYVAKSMLELWRAEKRCDAFQQRAKRHFKSAKNAVDDLVDKLDDINTEGEMTFEDGMISCSALQIALFALEADEGKENYVHAAEYMMNKHLCLEQKKIPDCRMRNGSLRYWEAQYDILTMPNMMCSPHGWTSWTLYGKYYLYLLTGKKEYLTDLMDGMGACVQLMTLDGKLRWGFICDPCIHASVFAPDKKLVNGYSGKFVEKVIGENYMDMISAWYRHERQIPTGGHLDSLLTMKDSAEKVDNQGGCCDNDVHEIFKCMEETVLKKAFIHQCENGEYLCYSCRYENGNMTVESGVDELIYCVLKPTKIKLNRQTIDLKSGAVRRLALNRPSVIEYHDFITTASRPMR